jgi:hypothetical protein
MSPGPVFGRLELLLLVDVAAVEPEAVDGAVLELLGVVVLVEEVCDELDVLSDVELACGVV